MHFTAFALSALVAGFAVASPAPVKRSPTKLPSTITIFANWKSNNTQAGCVGQLGNFTRNAQYCFPFRVFYTTGVDGNIRNGGTGTGCVVSGGTLDCSNTASSYAPFYMESTGKVLTLDGSTGANFSINSFPSATDTTGVPIVVGTGGKYAQLILTVMSTQG